MHGVHIVRQGVAVFAGDLAAKDGTKGAVYVGNVQADALGRFTSQLELFHQHLHVQRVFQMEVVAVLLDKVDIAVCNGRVVQDAVQIQFRCAAARGGGLDPQQVGAAHQLVHGAHAQLCHVLPQFLGHKGKVVDEVLRLAAEVLAQLGVLGADAHGAGVQIAHAHHHTALGHQQGSAEAELLCAQHAADGHIPAGQ